MTDAEDFLRTYGHLISEPEPDSILVAIEKMIREQFPEDSDAAFIISYCQGEILIFREALLEAWLK